MNIDINLKKVKKTNLKLEEYLVLSFVSKSPDYTLEDDSTIAILEELEAKGFIRLIENEIIVNPSTKKLLGYNHTAEIKEILAYFLELKKKHKMGARPLNFAANESKIEPRLAEGNTVADIKSVLDMKFEKWAGTEFQIYLRPTTIFNRSKFYNYLDELDQYQLEQSKSSDMYAVMKDDD